MAHRLSKLISGQAIYLLTAPGHKSRFLKPRIGINKSLTRQGILLLLISLEIF